MRNKIQLTNFRSKKDADKAKTPSVTRKIKQKKRVEAKATKKYDKELDKVAKSEGRMTFKQEERAEKKALRKKHRADVAEWRGKEYTPKTKKTTSKSTGAAKAVRKQRGKLAGSALNTVTGGKVGGTKSSEKSDRRYKSGKSTGKIRHSKVAPPKKQGQAKPEKEKYQKPERTERTKFKGGSKGINMKPSNKYGKLFYGQKKK